MGRPDDRLERTGRSRLSRNRSSGRSGWVLVGSGLPQDDGPVARRIRTSRERSADCKLVDVAELTK